MKYWLVKSEPGAYSWDDFVKLGRDHWDGVRNYQARNNMKLMKVGDEVLFYHSVNEKQVVGIARVVKEFYQDPTTDDDRWVVVDLVPVRKLEKPVTLAQIKADEKLEGFALIKNSRLSVMPVANDHYQIILEKSY
ncbi:MAG: EVE domain-containing protein [Cyclobacteriaceae bacterium]|nr:EVE domain-containing protein [Cyclobacteriaceae bacterium]MCK5281513.1 EVE domain-containing protein [Cyclobacteriaceae bacterium]MCK5470343.1 EVE domain-containing protein [Cyclobacteriaceae bacterium]